MKKLNAALIILAIFPIFTMCRVNLPIREMTAARVQIQAAYDVKADKYAPELLEKSEKHLYTSHDAVAKEEVDDAKKEATESINFATAAINKTLPLLSQDSLTSAKSTYSEAEAIYAEKLAADEFTGADALIKESEKLHGEKSYRQSYKKSQDALAMAQSAKSKSEEQIPSIQTLTEKLKNDRQQLLAMEGNEIAQSELTQAESDLNKAKEAFDAKNIKDAYTNNESASSQIDAARNKIVKQSVRSRITSLRSNIQQLKDSRGSESAGESLESAESLLNEAETLLEQDRNDDTIAKVEEAEAAFSRAQTISDKGIAGEKLEAAQLLYDKTKTKSYANRMKDKLNTASGLINEGKTLYDAESYKDSITKATEAETLLNSITLAGEGGYGSDYGTYGSGKGVYTVRYNKRAPDCLWRIAHRVYKNAKMWPLIYMANKNLIRDPDLIFPGQRFQIPPIPRKAEMQQADDGSENNSVEETMNNQSETEKEPMQKNNSEQNTITE